MQAGECLGRPLVIECAGETLWLLPEPALWWPAGRVLWVADLHLGKAATYRALGQPVPGGTTRENLARLSALLHHYRPAQLVFLGDFLHAAQSRTPSLLAALAASLSPSMSPLVSIYNSWPPCEDFLLMMAIVLSTCAGTRPGAGGFLYALPPAADAPGAGAALRLHALLQAQEPGHVHDLLQEVGLWWWVGCGVRGVRCGCEWRSGDGVGWRGAARCGIDT